MENVSCMLHKEEGTTKAWNSSLALTGLLRYARAGGRFGPKQGRRHEIVQADYVGMTDPQVRDQLPAVHHELAATS